MRCATRWLTGLSSASRIDSGGRARRPRAAPPGPAPRPAASARCTQASSSGGLNGLLIRSTMPTASATLASIGEPGVVITMKRMPGARPSRRDPLGELDAVHARHVMVDDRQRRRVAAVAGLAERRQRLERAADRLHLHAPMPHRRLVRGAVGAVSSTMRTRRPASVHRAARPAPRRAPARCEAAA